jgi:hypothetical protein
MPPRERTWARRPLARGLRALGAIAAVVAVGTGVALAAEPNDTPATASGPLTAGKAFNGSLETINDADWEFFYLPDTAQVTVTVKNTAKSEGKTPNRRRAIASTLFQARKGKPMVAIPNTTAKLRPGQQDKSKVTLAPGKYLIPVVHGASNPLADIPFRIQIAPPGSTTDSYEIFARRCAAAIARVHRVHRSKKHLAKRLARAKRKGKDAKVEKLSAKLDAKRRKAKVVQRAKRVACSVPR